MENYIAEALRSSNCEITVNDQRLISQYPLEEYSKLINNDYVQEVFGTLEPVLSLQELKDYFEDKQSTIYLIENVAPGSGQRSLGGYVVVGRFMATEPLGWPRWKLRDLPDNPQVLEIKLVGCRKGFARLIFSWVLLDLAKRKEEMLALSVLGSRFNTKAIEFYESYGFAHSIAYDTGRGPTWQVRDVHNQIIYYMVKLRETDKSYLNPFVLQSVLNLSRLNCNNNGSGLGSEVSVNGLTAPQSEYIPLLPYASYASFNPNYSPTPTNNFANLSNDGTTYAANGPSNFTLSTTTASSFISLSGQRRKESERQNLEELYKLGFIIQEEYLARKRVLDG